MLNRIKAPSRTTPGLMRNADCACDHARSGSYVPAAYELYFGDVNTHSLFFQQLEDAFYKEIWVRYGTSKFTHHHRLDDLNQLVEGLLPPERPLEIMDVAVSSGVSTVEWMHSLGQAGIDHRMVAGDAVIDAYVLSLGDSLRALVDRTGFLMQLEFRGRAVRIPRPHCLSRLRYLPLIVFVRSAVRLFRAVSFDRQSSQSAVRRWGITCRALKLVSRSLLQQPGADIIEDDILKAGEFARKFHVVRAANILNHGYFDGRTLRRMVNNLRGRLRPDGLLVICRTMPDEHNDATVFRLESDGRLSVVSRLNGGSEIEDLVVSLPASTD